MRRTGKGQQFDRLWGKANELVEKSFESASNDLLIEIDNLREVVSKKLPKSDYEVCDQYNLLDLLDRAYIRVMNNKFEDNCLKQRRN